MAIAKRKKKFFDVEMPLIEKTTQLIGYDIKELAGRKIKYDLTRILRGKSMLLDLDVIVDKEKATTKPKRITLLRYYLKRQVRKGTDYVEDSFETKCKDGKIKIKFLLVARRKISKAVRKALRKKAKEEIIQYAEKIEGEAIFDDIIKNKLQKYLSLSLKKTYPLSSCEIKSLEFSEEKK